MDLAVVDDGGHLLVFERMDGAKPSSIAISLVKAQSAALRRAVTAPAIAGDQINVPLALGLAIANPAHQTPIRGGVPLVVDGEVIGAIGASAGTEDQDLDVARAGAAVIEKA
jgi:glc operon protein GlcG